MHDLILYSETRSVFIYLQLCYCGIYVFFKVLKAGFGSITIDDYDYGYDYMSFLCIDYDYDYDYSSL